MPYQQHGARNNGQVKVFKRMDHTVKHVPQKAEAAWATCFMRCLAAAVFFDTPAAWTELAMLPKCVLCAPPRGGKAHEKAATAFTLDRLCRWSAGERNSLWTSVPEPKQQRQANINELARLSRADALTREGFDRKACGALVSDGLVEPSRTARDKLKTLHPERPVPASSQMSALPAAKLIHASDIAAALEKFSRDTAPGPTGLRVQHVLDAMTPGSERPVLEQLANLSNLLAS